MKRYYIYEEEEKFEELDKQRQSALLEWIKENFIERKTTNCKCGTSYRLKHIIQKQYKWNWKYYFTNEQLKRQCYYADLNQVIQVVEIGILIYRRKVQLYCM